MSVLNKSNSTILYRSNWDNDSGITYAVRRINKEEEDIIKNAIEKGIRIDLPWCRELNLSVNDIKIYGDFNINSKTHRDVIKKMHLAGPDGSYLPAGFSYKDGCVNSYPKVNYKYTICFRHMFYFAYCYTVIGRPERIAIYTYTKRQYKARLKS